MTMSAVIWLVICEGASCPAQESAFAASALPHGFHFDRFRHEFIAERLETCENLRAGKIRCFGEAGKTKTLFGFVHEIFGIQHSARDIVSVSAGFKGNYAWPNDAQNFGNPACPRAGDFRANKHNQTNKIRINRRLHNPESSTGNVARTEGRAENAACQLAMCKWPLRQSSSPNLKSR